MKGIFELRTASDLYEKLKYDYLVFSKNQNDSKFAYNFFVTAWHLLEWTYPGDKDKQNAIRNSNVVLQICEHIAVGAKHFEPTAVKHKSVKSSGITGLWAKGFWAEGLWAKGVWAEKLMVELENEASTIYGSSVKATALADDVMKLWKSLEDDIT